jgi:hypothetical protein
MDLRTLKEKLEENKCATPSEFEKVGPRLPPLRVQLKQPENDGSMAWNVGRTAELTASYVW